MTLRAIRTPLSALALSTLLFVPLTAQADDLAPAPDTTVSATPDQDASAATPSVEWPLTPLYCV